ncbi:MAG: PDZ domain-containing protein, partial [Planctomycetes bacterium]|nr:PDZ domain-containing protein [Planctomycetota bacterium]
MRLWKEFCLALALSGLVALPAVAQDADAEVEKILKKYDEKMKRLREEMRQELEQLLGKKAAPEATPGQAADLGIEVEPAKESVRAILNLAKNEGLVVRKVADGGAAKQAGIRKFDILVAVDGGAVGTADDLRKALSGKKPGDRVTLTVVRESERVKVEAVLGGREAGAPEKPSVGEFLDETFQAKGAQVRKNLRDLLQGDTQARMKARRFFEDLLNRSEKDRERILAELEKVAEEFLDKVDAADREALRKAFRDVLKGFRQSVEKPPGPAPSGKKSQSKEDIEKFLEDLLEGKSTPGKKPPAGDKDDIDKLLDELLGKKAPAEPPKEGPEADLPVKIPPEWDQALENILGKEGWARFKNMMKSPEYREMLKQFFPEGFEFNPKNVRKLLQQYGVELEALPDRLREMGVEEDAIDKIMKLLKEEGAPEKKAKGWIGFRVKEEEGGGVVVSKVEPQSPALEAGFQEGDVLVDIDGAEVR